MSAAEITIHWVADGDQLQDALALREEVFCGEQGVSLAEEHDGRDAQARHLLALAPGGEVIGTLRVLESDGTAKIGRVAVRRSWRRQGIALAMLERAVEHAAAHGCTRARLAAQLDAIELYRRAGFVVESETFSSARIEHVWMGCSLAAAETPSR